MNQLTAVGRVTRYVSVSRLKQWAWALVRFVIIFGLCFEILYPLIAKTVQVFMAEQDLTDVTVKLFPKHFSLDFMKETFSLISYPKTLLNTFVISLVVSVIQLFICTAAGYGFARFKFKGRGLLFAGVLLMLLVPPQVYGSGMYLYFKEFGIPGVATITLTGGYIPIPLLILSLTGMGLKNGLYIFIMRQLYRGIPTELEEAAYIDGYGPFRTFWHIMIPCAKNMMITVFVLSFSWQWTDVFYSSLFSNSNSSKTLASAILYSISRYSFDGSNVGTLIYSIYRNCGVLLVIIPLLIMFGFLQKRLVESIEHSGLVG